MRLVAQYGHTIDYRGEDLHVLVVFTPGMLVVKRSDRATKGTVTRFGKNQTTEGGFVFVKWGIDGLEQEAGVCTAGGRKFHSQRRISRG
eukprot:SAG22_NODE_9488_length_587_cov_1.059426_2_plen_89_part_00